MRPPLLHPPPHNLIAPSCLLNTSNYNSNHHQFLTIRRGKSYDCSSSSSSSSSSSDYTNPNNSNNTLNSRRTCKNCKTLFDPSFNNPRSCRFHTAHFGGETKRKFESVHSGGTMDTPGSGKVLQYWHCCGSEDPFDAGCTAAPHMSYDD
ncbi:hypothetical protein ACFE04_010779 [Oxalis oulophora]